MEINWYTVGWIVWGILFFIIEGLALKNAYSRGTLSGHVWAWIGIRQKPKPSCSVCGKWYPCNTGDDGGAIYPPPLKPTKWTRIRQFTILFMMAWGGVHLATGVL